MTSVYKLARDLRRLEKRVRDTATKPRLPWSSIDGGAITLRDSAGNDAGFVGQQFDGTVTAAAVGGSWPSTPTQPLVQPVTGGLRIYWDGTYVDGSLTRMDFRRVTFHAVTDLGTLDILSPAQIVGEVTIATGGEVTVSLPYIEHFVVAVVWTDAGKFSEPSDPGFGTPTYVTTMDIDPSVPIGGGPDGAVPVVPADWNVDLRPLGLMSLQATWDAVQNDDAVEYDLYASTTTPVALDSAHFVGTTGATGHSFGDINGTALLAGTDYYVSVVVRDADGPAALKGTAGPLQVQQAGSGSVAPEWTYLGPVSADQIMTGSLDATIAVIGSLTTSNSGRNVSLSSAAGLKAVDPNGNLVAHIPTDLQQNIQLAADVVLKSATAEGPVAFRHGGNEIAQGGVVTVRAALSAPVTPPTVTAEWPGIGTPPSGLNPAFLRGGSYHAASNRIYQGYHNWTGDGASTPYSPSGTIESSIKVFDADTGALVQSWEVGTPGDPYRSVVYAVSRYGNDVYALAKGGSYYYIWRFTTAGAFVSRYIVPPGSLNGEPFAQYDKVGKRIPSMTINQRTGQLIFVYSDRLTKQVQRHSFDRDTGAVFNQNTSDLVLDGDIHGIYEGPVAGEHDDDRLYISSSAHPPHVFCTFADPSISNGYLRDLPREFPSAYNEPVGMVAYDSTDGVFKTRSRTTGWMFRYDGTMWLNQSSTWHITHTWRDTDPSGGLHETAQGPPSVMSFPKRASLRVTVPPIPSDANPSNLNDPIATAVYVGRSGGAQASQYRQAAPAVGERTASINKVVFDNVSGTRPNPPVSGNFPNGVAGVFKTGAEDVNGPMMWVDGAGNGRWDALEKRVRAKVLGRYINMYDMVPFNGFPANSGVYEPASWTVPVPSGAQVATVAVDTNARAVGNALVAWDLFAETNLIGTTLINASSTHNSGDQYTNMGATMVGEFDVNGATTLIVRLRGSSGSGGSTVFTRRANITVTWKSN